ncbi:MAG TPA: hypothetical protein VG228_00130 [Solirubrobacteraceae bacterium]|nr:hypothetical protein [Solirubrobacteraceae bacterium]
MRRILILCGLAVLAPATWLLAGGSALASSAPVATTSGATAITSTGATVNGTVNPTGQATTYAFQWGLTGSYGNEAPLPPASAGAGTADVPVSVDLGGLASGTVYHFRVIASNAGGAATGADETFTTGGTSPTPATVTTGSPSNVTATSAVLNGSVVPGATPTTCSFAYGPTTSYGSLTNAQPVAAATTSVAMTATISGLAPTTAFHYQLVCNSATGTVSGADQTLTTLAAPARIAIAGRRLFISPTGLVGVFVACFGGHPCSGTLSLRAGNTAIAPAVHYSFTNEKETVVFTTLTRAVLRQLKARGTLTATATAADSDGSKSTIPFTLYRELL